MFNVIDGQVQLVDHPQPRDFAQPQEKRLEQQACHEQDTDQQQGIVGKASDPAQAAGGQGIGRKGHDKRARVRKTA